jgi:hypothetical protein
VTLRFALALALAALLVARQTRADAPASHDVLLVIAADDRSGDDLEQVARELLGRQSVALRIARAPRIDLREITVPSAAARAWLARAWIDLREPDHATLYVYDPLRDRLLVRAVPRSSGGDELAREELGHILETCIEGLLSGANVGLPRSDVVSLLAPEPERSKQPSEEPYGRDGRDRRVVRFGALYEIAMLADRAPITHGPALAAWVRIPVGAFSIGPWVTAQYRFPIEVAPSPVGGRFASMAFRALAVLERVSSSTLTWRFGLGGGLDVVRVTPQSSDARFLPDENRTLGYGVARAAFAVDARIASSIALTAMVAADLDPSAATYVVAARDGEHVVMRPWPVRPALMVGLVLP